MLEPQLGPLWNKRLWRDAAPRAHSHISKAHFVLRPWRRGGRLKTPPGGFISSGDKHHVELHHWLMSPLAQEVNLREQEAAGFTT
ncbi:hypothetical protein EYF80_062789 [Liparis tanakae]|uniref:Uncharacterized protein n=1 Tax=Liparis tanakae TaxID=230148 RepID=A0A4Z2EE80_9TELE|nr:hypothetical protein EYF80_062789 [Liparis tanakae]